MTAAATYNKETINFSDLIEGVTTQIYGELENFIREYYSPLYHGSEEYNKNITQFFFKFEKNEKKV